MKHVGIIGGGVIGVCSAYYLQRSGHRVTIIDQGDMLDGCSYGNAGMIVPSHFIPLAAPGMISKGMRWMLRSTSPFFVRPRLDARLLRWGWIFYRSSTREKVERGAPALLALSLLSKRCYEQLSQDIPLELKQRGLMMLYQTKATGEEELAMVEMAHELGVEAKVLTSSEIQAMEPHVRVTALGGIYFPGDAHVTPMAIMRAIREKLMMCNVRLLTGERVTGFAVSNRVIKKVKTSNGEHEFDEVILASGAWSSSVAEQLGITIPMQAGKGYSFMLKDVNRNITIPTIFLEDRVAVTPMDSSLRFGGTMEIGGIDHSIDMNRVKGIVNAIPKYYPDMNVTMPSREEVWSGLRPCSPDGLPYIGRTKVLDNLVIATGHGMMGIGLGPGTGKIVADIVERTETGVDTSLFAPDRFI